MLPEIRLLKILRQKRLTLAIAESCTGGLLSNRITNIPGSSRAFLLGITAYSNKAKNQILKIPKVLLQAKGAASAETAKLMAVNIVKLSGSAIGIGITGIAGPAGGTKEKPVGTVFIAVTSGKKILSKKFHFRGNRQEIKRKATDKALTMLLNYLAISYKL